MIDNALQPYTEITETVSKYNAGFSDRIRYQVVMHLALLAASLDGINQFSIDILATIPNLVPSLDRQCWHNMHGLGKMFFALFGAKILLKAL